MGYQEWDEILMITLISRKNLGVCRQCNVCPAEKRTKQSSNKLLSMVRLLSGTDVRHTLCRKSIRILTTIEILLQIFRKLVRLVSPYQWYFVLKRNPHLTFFSVILCLGIDVVSILLDIVVLAIWYPHDSKVRNNSSEQFSAVMAIFNLIFR